MKKEIAPYSNNVVIIINNNSKTIKNYNKPVETQPVETQLVETQPVQSREEPPNGEEEE